MQIYNYDSIQRISEKSIIFSDGLEIYFDECIKGFKRKYCNFKNTSTCIAERNIFAKPPYFQFYINNMEIKLVFNCKGLFTKKRNENLFHSFQNKILNMGYKSFDLS